MGGAGNNLAKPGLEIYLFFYVPHGNNFGNEPKIALLLFYQLTHSLGTKFQRHYKPVSKDSGPLGRLMTSLTTIKL